jgi:hypothetical protein
MVNLRLLARTMFGLRAQDEDVLAMAQSKVLIPSVREVHSQGTHGGET